MNETLTQRIEGRFVWYSGYLLFKPDNPEDNIDTIPVIAFEHGGSLFDRPVFVSSMELRTIKSEYEIFPEDLREYRVVFGMHPESFSISNSPHTLGDLLGYAVRGLIPAVDQLVRK